MVDKVFECFTRDRQAPTGGGYGLRHRSPTLRSRCDPLVTAVPPTTRHWGRIILRRKYPGGFLRQDKNTRTRVTNESNFLFYIL